MSDYFNEVLPTQAPLDDTIAAIVAAAQGDAAASPTVADADAADAVPAEAASTANNDDELLPSQAPLSATIAAIQAAVTATENIAGDTPSEVAADVQDAEMLETTNEQGESVAPVTPDYDDAEPTDELLDDDQDAFEESVDELIDAAEESDAAPVEAWDETVTGAMAEMEDIAENEHIEHEHAHSDVVTLPYFGTFEVPGGIYTVVFVALALLTVVEVLAAETFPETGILLTFQISILMLAAVAKSALVVIFYMHLRTDNRLFRLVLALPLLVVLISLIYLLAVPTTAGLGYQ